MDTKKPVEGLATSPTGNNSVGDQPDARIISTIYRTVNREKTGGLASAALYHFRNL